MLMLTGCPAFTDWEYNDLPNDYAISRVNVQNIQLNKESDGLYRKVVDKFIIAFCYNSRYIALQRVPIDNTNTEMFDVEKIYASNPEYYLIDSETDTVYGPLTIKEYEEQIINLHIENMCEWISTDANPN